MQSLLPEPGAGAGTGARGAGAEFRLFDMDPDAAARRAEVAGWYILQPPTDKPNGLRECYLLDLGLLLGARYCDRLRGTTSV